MFSKHKAHKSNSSPNTRGDSEGIRGQSVRRRANGCHRGSRGGLNRAESSYDESFNPSRNGGGTQGRSVHRRGGRRRGNRGRQKRAGDDDDDDGNGGWAYLRDEEVYQECIKPSDEQFGYCGDRELSNDSSYRFLSLFLTYDSWNLITMETNRYAHQYLSSHVLMPSSRFHEWYYVTVHEMKAFLSLHLSMGLVHKSEIEYYWAEFWPTSTAGFGKVMPRNRFKIILSFFHFANNEEYVERGQPGL